MLILVLGSVLSNSAQKPPPSSVTPVVLVLSLLFIDQ